VNGRV